MLLYRKRGEFARRIQLNEISIDVVLGEIAFTMDGRIAVAFGRKGEYWLCEKIRKCVRHGARLWFSSFSEAGFTLSTGAQKSVAFRH